MIKSFSINEEGNDYVVGDIHGCFTKLDKQLYELGFDKKKDRLFSVGDLVDRGSESHRCISFLQKPWFHAVMGNHELMAMQYYSGQWPKDNYVLNGGEWFVKLPREYQETYIEALANLPILIEVETKSGKVGVVHADCPIWDWDDLKEKVEAQDTKIINLCLWERTRLQKKFNVPIKAIDRVYVGHSFVRQPMALGNVHYIDTGAVFGHNLTIVKL